MALWYGAGPLRDLDSFWHIQLGQQIARLHRVTDLPAWWLAVPQPRGWLTSQWLSELGMYAATDVGGWRALMVVNLVLMAAFLLGLFFTLLRNKPALAAVPVFVLVVIGCYGAVQQRPQAVSIILLPWLALACQRLLTGGRCPPPWLVATGCLLWAQFHGLWILAPAGFALAAAGAVLDPPRSVTTPAPGSALRARLSAARPALVCLLCSMAGLLNPQGARSLLLPFRFKAATTQITEWWPTTITFTSFTLTLLVLILATFAGWARCRSAVPASEILWMVAWTVFALQSFRNVSPAILMIAPVCLAAVTRAATGPSSARTGGSQIGRGTGPQESRILAGTGVLIILAGLLLAAGRAGSIDPLSRIPARQAAVWASRQPQPVRIFNTYNAAGAMIGLSGHKARIVIDGRADLWGADYIDRMDRIEKLAPGWRPALIGLHPDAVVTLQDSALATALTASGWRIELTDHHLVLLLPATGTGRLAGSNPPKP